MDKYQPNFSNKKVKNRITQAIEFIEKYVFNEPVPIAKTQIVKYFGQSQKDLSKYLKDQLLICTDHYFNWTTGQCKKYIRNEQGLLILKQQIGLSLVTPQLQAQLDTGSFIYTEKSDRLFNPLQYAPKRVKRPVMTQNGYNYNYDIECAAPTLLYQYARRLAAREQILLELPHIECYLQDRSLVRYELSIRHNLSEDIIKQIITALFQGGQLGLNSRTRLYQTLNGNFYVIQKLKSDEYITNLLIELKSMWSYIIKEMKLISNKKRILGRDKASKYRELEKEVMSVIRKELVRTNNKFLLMHDGWISKEICDRDYLIDLVRNKTGYVIKIDWEIWE